MLPDISSSAASEVLAAAMRDAHGSAPPYPGTELRDLIDHMQIAGATPLVEG